ncbi:MAG TPA: hypothetical protein VIL90_10745 [Puia sp.]
MKKLSRSEKMWLILFAIILVGLIGGCMYETVSNHKPVGPRPAGKQIQA